MSGELRYRSNYRPRRRGLTPLQIAGIMIAAIVVLIVAIVGCCSMRDHEGYPRRGAAQHPNGQGECL